MNQCNKILEYLKQGHKLTPLEGLQLFGTMRLGARVWDLRKQGYNIQSWIIKGDNNKHWAEYHLIQHEKQLEFVNKIYIDKT